MKRNSVFISYSKKDTKWLAHLRTHLSYLEREYKFSIWQDSRIQVGADWRVEIENAINTARVAILMVSANFISSEFIANEELPALLNAAEKEGALIFPIIVGHCMFSDIDTIAKFQSVNSPTHPLTAMNESERDELFVKVTREIKTILSSENGLSKERKSFEKKQNSTNAFAISFIRIIVLRILYNTSIQYGLTISELYDQTKTIRRKQIVQVLQEAIALELLLKARINGKTYFKITDKGKKLVEIYKGFLL